MRCLAAAASCVYSLTITFVSIDWIMSLEPHWFSTIFGVLIIGGQGLSALAFTMLIVLVWLEPAPLSDVVGAEHLHDLGKLMLVFVMLWAYFTFSQFIIIWSGNLPEEIPWYLSGCRAAGGSVGAGAGGVPLRRCRSCCCCRAT